MTADTPDRAVPPHDTEAAGAGGSDAAEPALAAGTNALQPDNVLNENYWGTASDALTTAHTIASQDTTQLDQLQSLLSASVSCATAAEILGATEETVVAKLQERTLIGIKIGDEFRLPLWQFDPNMTAGILPDLDTLQGVFPGGPVSLSEWMLRPCTDFDGRSPRDEMTQRGSAAVIALAQILTAAAW